MNLFKDKGFCLLEVVAGIAVLVLGFLLVGALISQTAYYAARVRLLTEGINRAIGALEQQQPFRSTLHPYDIQLERFVGTNKVLFYRSTVSWHIGTQQERIILVTCLIGGAHE